MEIITIPPFVTGSVTWQEQPGQWSLTVVCKVTYALKSGTSIVAMEPEGVNERDNHWDDDPGKCVYAPSDLAPYKPRPEVLLVGSAFAPRREPLRSLFARLVVADVDKSIEVLGARTVARDGAVADAQKWTQMPLRYERAAGGDDSWNPVGIDPSVVDAYGRRTLPNLQPPGLTDADGSRPIPTVGFGPIASRWLVRSAKLGALVGAFAKGTWTETPLGMEFDGSYFQSAPSDQLVSELRPDEPILLENMHPELERFSTRLPGIKPHMRVEIEGLPPWEPDLVPDTLWIDTNRAIASLTFRAQIPLDGRDQPGRIFIGVEYPGEPVRFPEPTRAAPEPTPVIDADDDDLDLTQTTGDKLQGIGVNPLPFAAAPQPPQPPPSQAPPRPRPPPEEDPNDTAVFVGTIPRDAMPAWLAGKKNPPAPAPAPPAMPIAPPVPQLLRPAESAAPAPPPPMAAPPLHAAPPMAAPPPPIPTPPQTHLAPPPLRPQVPSLPGVVVPHSAPPAPALPIQPPPVTRPAGTTVGQAAVLAAQKARPAPEPPPPAAPPAPIEKDPSRSGKKDPRVLATAAFLGAAEASNAAATVPAEDDREKERRDKPAATTPAAAPATAGFLVDLLWFAPELPPRLAENETWKSLFETAAPAAPEEPESEASEDPWNDEDPEASAPKPRKKPERKKEKTPEEKAKEDKSRVSKVLTRALPTLDVESALFSAVNDDGVLEPPLLVVAGDLELPFDEVEVLKVLSSAAAPLAVGDKKLKETLDLANEALGTPLGSSADVAANFSLRVREAWAKANRMLPPDYLDVHSRRVLLEQRKYQKRELSGAEWIRALLFGPMVDKGIPTYLPIDLSKKLPLFSRFSARLIVEALPQQDQSESQIVALRVLALARTVAGRPKR